MARFSKKLRQQIVEEFSVRHNGHFNPALFLQEVRNKGTEHPAYDWFEWDEGKAALAYQVEQAREFARDLRVLFTIEEIGRNKIMRVVEQEMPMVLSPLSGRRSGGGYLMVDTGNPEHMAEHCLQAAQALRSWLGRYQSALVHTGQQLAPFERCVRVLLASVPHEKEQEEAA